MGKRAKITKIDAETPDPDVMAEAAAIVAAGGIVVLPTETVYGVAADAFNETACNKIYEAKDRPHESPLPVFIADLSQLSRVVRHVPAVARRLVRELWPGPITVVMDANPDLPMVVTAATSTVGVRIPDHPVALELVRRAACPLACTSANRSGQPSARSANRIDKTLLRHVDLVLDGGPTQIGVASTVLDLTGTEPRLLRIGSVSIERVEEVIGVRVER